MGRNDVCNSELGINKHFNLKKMKIYKLFLFLLYVLAFNLDGNAQEHDGGDYRTAVKDLITSNKEHQVFKTPLLAGFSDIKEYDIRMIIFEAKYPRANDLKRVWKKYQEEQWLEDQIDVFMEISAQAFTLSELQEIEKSLPAIEKNNTIQSSKANILMNFDTTPLNLYLKGNFKGFEAPDCSDSYKQLCRTYYKQSGMEDAFNKRLKEILKIESYARHKKEVSAFFEENASVFFMLICHKNMSEEDLQGCVHYLSSTAPTFSKLQDFSETHDLETRKLCQKKFRQWFKREELELYGILQEWEREFGSGMKEE